MNRIKIAGAATALVGSALIGSTLISSALATPAASQKAPTAVAHLDLGDAYSDAYLDALANELGVDRASLGPAAQAAATAAIDAALAAGDITEERATELKDKVAALEDPETLLVSRGFSRGGERGDGWARDGHDGRGVGVAIHESLDAAAEALAIEKGDLIQRVRDGSTLEEIANTEGVTYDTVAGAIKEVASSQLASAVAQGRLTQERADEITAKLEAWLDAGGDPADAPFGARRGR